MIRRIHRRLTTCAAIAVALTLAGQAMCVSTARADETRDQQWHLRYLDVAAAHRLTQGEGVRVGVVDSGVDAKHPDLAGAVLPGTDFVGGDGTIDGSGHGTAMAGLIAARGQPGGAGALGIAPRAMVLPVENGFRGGSTPEGIDWAIAQGARVICLALGDDLESARMKEAMGRAMTADVVIVAAAGNRPDNTRVVYPARHPGVIAAAGTDQNGNHAEVSVTGPEVVLAAPAVEITSTGLNKKYRTGTGTSDATAIIAGAAALVRAKFPHLKATEVVHRLTATATDKGTPGRDNDYGFGVLNIVAALTADIPPLESTAPGGNGPEAAPPGDDTGGLDPVALTLLGLFTIGAVAIAAVTVVAIRRGRNNPDRAITTQQTWPTRGPPR